MPFGLHAVTHNPFGIFFIVVPYVVVLAKLLELGRAFLMKMLPDAEWINYSWKSVYFSAVLGCFIHLGWDVTMHRDINLGFPFVYITNPFINGQLATWIGILSLTLILPAYFVGARISKGNPFRKLP